MPDPRMFSFQTRLVLNAEQDAALCEYAARYGRIERTLFAEVSNGMTPDSLKSSYLRRFGITARQFNAISIGLKGKIDGIKQRRIGLISEASLRIKRAQRTIAKLSTAPKHEPPPARSQRLHALHQKKRRAAMLIARTDALKADHAAGKVRLCFGSKKRFHAQFDPTHIQDTPPATSAHADWLAQWQQARSNQFVVIGSKDETAGCQGCIATIAEDGSLNLKLRLPNALAQDSAPTPTPTHLELGGLRFDCGHEPILAALASSRVVRSTGTSGTARRSLTGSALTYRFVRDEGDHRGARGWRVFVSTNVAAPDETSKSLLGTVGVDINADHLALAEIDRFGNPVHVKRIDTPLRGKTSAQRTAILGDAAALIVAHAASVGKPLVLEKLDFTQRKSEMESVDPKRARTLSALSYARAHAMISARAFKAGVTISRVNPAYTSVIGALNHAQSRGVSVHLGAAIAIARRGSSLMLSERPTSRTGLIPVRSGGHVTLDLPVRNRLRHVWSFWSAVKSGITAAHRAHFRLGAARANPAPLSPATRTSCAIWTLPVEPRYANRREHCSPDVHDFDVNSIPGA